MITEELRVVVRAEAANAIRELERLKTTTTGNTSAFAGMAKTLVGFGGVTAALLATKNLVIDNIKAGVDYAAAIEKQTVAFEVLLNSSDKARMMMKDIQDFSASTPFQLPELTSAAQRLLSFGTAAEDVVDTMQRLGDLSMGNAETLVQALDPDRVIAGTTAHGATFLGPGSIRHAGAGETAIGPWSSAGATGVQTVSEVFQRSGIDTRIVTDVRSVMWAKLLINVGINAITALTGIKNGQLLDLEQTRRLSREAVEEAMAVAKTLGFAIEGDPVEKVFSVATATTANRSSMGQDVDNRRMTEIGAINGFVVRAAQEAGVPVPVNRALTALVETMQAHF